MAVHPLNRPASWSLTRGAPDARPIRWLAAGLWLSAGACSVVWLLALTDDAVAGHASLLYPLLAWPAVSVWLYVAWRLWVRWVAGAEPLTLQWHGPVVREHGRARASGGFHVAQWRTPVHVHVAFSWQGWILLGLTRAQARAPDSATVYAWLDARESDPTADHFRHRSLHQLRTLLHLPGAMTTQVSGVQAPVASWVHSFNPGSILRRLVSLSHKDDSSSTAVAPSRQDTAFPATAVMAERRGTAHSLQARQGRGQR